MTAKLVAQVLAVVAVVLTSPVRAAVIFLGPTPYSSAADSPFDVSRIQLEDFEDGELNTPGISSLSNTFVRSPGPNTDSVDGDDGTLDGFGTSGHSIFSDGALIEPTSPPRYYMDMAFAFAPIDGKLPNVFGFVVTDCAPNSSIHILLLDHQLRVLDQFYTLPFFEGGLGDDTGSGTTSEDRFFGVTDPRGIQAVRITLMSRDDPFGGIELDHLQFGTIVPEPSSWIMVLTAVMIGLGCVSLQRLRHMLENQS